MAISTNSKKECPMCRAVVNIDKVHIIVDASKTSKKNTTKELPEKMDVLINNIKANPAKRTLVFSEFTFKHIEKAFKENEIKYSQLNGSGYRISNIIREFKEGNFQVLLLNAQHFGAGLNLQFTDDILIYHRMSKDLEKQVVGRAQRLGRTTPLNITYLCYENEYPMKNINKAATSST